MVGLMSDPPGLSRTIRRRYEPLPWGPDPRRTVVRLREKAYLRKVDARLLELLRRFPSVGMFGAHHAEWALSHGVAAWYAPSPIVDLGGPRLGAAAGGDGALERAADPDDRPPARDRDDLRPSGLRARASCRR